MKYFLICALLFQTVAVQSQTNEREIYSKQFNWKIRIPEGFDSVSAAEWAKMQDIGNKAIDDATGSTGESISKTILVFKTGVLNYLEANHQPFDTTVDGDFIESCNRVNEIVYQTFKTQVPNTQIDTATSEEKVDGLVFQLFKVKILYPNNITFNAFSFSRLFGDEQLMVNIMYIEEAKGALMLNAWRNSTFK